MISFVVLAVFYVFLQGVDCYLFNDHNETAKLNLNCEKGGREVAEGNNGQTNLFPWLGILRVHIHEKGSIKIAVTGIVLVKDKFAVGNANDISKIPHGILRSDSKVMFIYNSQPWYCTVVDYMAHPEYEITTDNTVGILELSKESGYIPIKPICWPHKNFNTSDELYAIGFTDENQLLEKNMFKLGYVDKKLCYEFYQRSNLTQADLSVPANFRCAYGVNSPKNCMWDTGMVVASNASGQWTLIGLVISGPGCAAPARFIDSTAYMPWLVTTMDLDSYGGPSEDIIMRRSPDTGFQRNQTQTLLNLVRNGKPTGKLVGDHNSKSHGLKLNLSTFIF